MEPTLNAIVVGVGSLGKQHARIYAENSKTNLLAVLDSNTSTRNEIAKQWNTRPCASIDEIEEPIHLASVVVPTVAHYRVASQLLERGVPVLVEKPITMTVEEGNALIDLAKKKNLVLQVGHIERFNPAVLKLSDHLKGPLFIESHRLGPPAERVKDIGVVLDLMIHDLDLILSLVNSKIESLEAVGVPIVTQREDIANARLRFESGCIANLTVSRVSPERQRKIRFFQKDTYISLDFIKPELQVYKKKTMLGIPSIDHSVPDLTMREPLAAEIDSFIDCVLHNKKPVVSGEDGVEALHWAETITKQVHEVTAKLKKSNLY